MKNVTASSHLTMWMVRALRHYFFIISKQTNCALNMYQVCLQCQLNTVHMWLCHGHF